jgi:hypothetical protein
MAALHPANRNRVNGTTYLLVPQVGVTRPDQELERRPHELHRHFPRHREHELKRPRIRQGNQQEGQGARHQSQRDVILPRL